MGYMNYQVLPIVTFIDVLFVTFSGVKRDLYSGDQKVRNGRSWELQNPPKKNVKQLGPVHFCCNKMTLMQCIMAIVKHALKKKTLNQKSLPKPVIKNI